MNLAVIGLGLMGGSLALKLKKESFCDRIIGFDSTPHHQAEALSLGIIDEIASLESIYKNADIIVVAIPVNALITLIPEILDNINRHTIVIDLGSTKEEICSVTLDHSNRNQFVACHPIAGTENSGPSAAFEDLFKGKVNIICDAELSSTHALNSAKQVFELLGMRNVFQSSSEHDRHIAYVSHLSHISSFALGKTVLEIEDDEKNIFNMAGSGFASTVRLAKSSPDMWAPIFDQNAKNISQALGKYIDNLNEFKVFIDNHLTQNTYQIMSEVNDIRRVLNGIELKEHKK